MSGNKIDLTPEEMLGNLLDGRHPMERAEVHRVEEPEHGNLLDGRHPMEQEVIPRVEEPSIRIEQEQVVHVLDRSAISSISSGSSDREYPDHSNDMRMCQRDSYGLLNAEKQNMSFMPPYNQMSALSVGENSSTRHNGSQSATTGQRNGSPAAANGFVMNRENARPPQHPFRSCSHTFTVDRITKLVTPTPCCPVIQEETEPLPDTPVFIHKYPWNAPPVPGLLIQPPSPPRAPPPKIKQKQNREILAVPRNPPKNNGNNSNIGHLSRTMKKN